MRHFLQEFVGRPLILFTDHKPLLGSFKKPELQQHDPVVLNAINEITQFTSDIRYKAGPKIPVADWLSRPDQNKNQNIQDSSRENSNANKPLSSFDPPYVPPERTLAALEEVALHSVSPAALAKAQETCPEVEAHRRGDLPRGVVVDEVNFAGVKLLCEVSDPVNPRPLVPASERNLILNLIHHNDHPNAKETVKRVSKDYYWPALRTSHGQRYFFSVSR